MTRVENARYDFQENPSHEIRDTAEMTHCATSALNF